LNDYEEFIIIGKLLKDKVGEVCSQLSPNFSLHLDNVWININRKGDFNKPHYHVLSAFSACLYLQVPEKSGNIIFHGNKLLHHYPIFTDSPLFYTETIYKPEPGKLILFPSCIEHSVEANNSDEPRISMAFNFLQDKQ